MGAGTTAGAALDEAARRLRAAGVENPRLDARLLLAHALETPGERFYGREDAAVPAGALQTFRRLVERRRAREPVSRILRRRGFRDLELEVDRATLDPRPDSETLVEAALDAFPDRGAPLRALDLGTGTGCLLLALLSARPRARGLGVDISAGCVAAASRNAARHGLAGRARFRRGDWTSGLEGAFDIVLCNPPYIPTGAIAGLAPEVARHEPRLALDGGPDGLAPHRRLLPGLAGALAPGGRAFVEAGPGQGGPIRRIAAAHGLAAAGTRADLAGRERCVVLKRADSP